MSGRGIPKGRTCHVCRTVRTDVTNDEVKGKLCPPCRQMSRVDRGPKPQRIVTTPRLTDLDAVHRASKLAAANGTSLREELAKQGVI